MHRRCRGSVDRFDRGSGRIGLWRAAQILSFRQIQDEAEAGAEAVAQSPDDRHQRREGRETRLSAAREDRGSGVYDPRPGFGAGKRDLSGDAGGRGRAARRARRRGRNPRRAQNARARDERAARGSTGQRPAAPRRRHAVARRQRLGRGAQPAPRICRQGRHLRYRRHLDQTGRRHGRHEMGHGGLRRGHRPDAAARRAQRPGKCGRGRRPGREYAVRYRAASGRHRHLDVRSDDRSVEHRRRGPVGARRRAVVLPGSLQAAPDHRSGDVDGCRHRRARPPSGGPLLEQ